MELFAEIVGREHVRTDLKSRRAFSNDVFFWPNGRTCRAIVAPGSPEEVVRVVRAAGAIGCGVVCRGTGTSSAAGYVPHEDDSVILDLRRLDRIRHLDLDDQHVTVEAGCTWETLGRALQGTGARPAFAPAWTNAPTTVGGTLSRGSAHDMTGVLGVEVVTGLGKLLRTGSAARAAHPSPFFRCFGPDLTGLFLGDGGRFGVKTAASFALEPLPQARAHACFAFETLEAAMRAIVSCCRMRLSGRMRASAARSDDPDAPWILEVTVEAVSARAAEDAVALHRQHCSREGTEIARPPAAEGRAAPAPDGERGVSFDAVLPLSVAEAAATRVRQFFGQHRVRMRQSGLTVSHAVTARPGAILLDAILCWQEAGGARRAAHGAQPGREALPNVAARAAAFELREGLKETLAKLGAAHVELAKLHPYRSILAPQNAEALERLRTALDPDGRVNPGNLER